MGTRIDFLDRENGEVALTSGVASRDAPDAPDSTYVDERRVFLTACSSALMASATALAMPAAVASSPQPVKRYGNSILTDEFGQPIRAASLKPLTNYLFHYPFVATPCLMIDMGRNVGGVGSRKSIVAFSAICSHKLAYPAREVSFIRFQAKASTRSAAERIHCCADHSVYDPAEGARVVSGPAPVALAAIALEHDSKTDTLRAVGTIGVEQFDAFFGKYEFKLGMDYGNRARDAVASSAKLQELTQFCRNVAQC